MYVCTRIHMFSISGTRNFNFMDTYTNTKSKYCFALTHKYTHKSMYICLFAYAYLLYLRNSQTYFRALEAQHPLARAHMCTNKCTRLCYFRDPQTQFQTPEAQHLLTHIHVLIQIFIHTCILFHERANTFWHTRGAILALNHMYVYIYIHICACIYIHTCDRNGGGECVEHILFQIIEYFWDVQTRFRAPEAQHTTTHMYVFLGTDKHFFRNCRRSAHRFARTHTHTHTHTHTYAHIYGHTHTSTLSQELTHLFYFRDFQTNYRHCRRSTHWHKYMCKRVCTCHPPTHIYVYICMYIHTSLFRDLQTHFRVLEAQHRLICVWRTPPQAIILTSHLRYSIYYQ